MRVRLAARSACMVVCMALAAGQTACGTIVYSHRVRVSIDDPAHRLGTEPVEVSVFDKQMGYSESWARKTMGIASAETPYSTALAGSGAQMFFDPPRPDQVVLSIAVPRLEPAGYLVVIVTPGKASSGEVPANFTPYGEFFPPPRLPVATARYHATPAPKGWELSIRLQIPPVPPDSVPETNRRARTSST